VTSSPEFGYNSIVAVVMRSGDYINDGNDNTLGMIRRGGCKPTNSETLKLQNPKTLKP
jgi:hypothetical protein